MRFDSAKWLCSAGLWLALLVPASAQNPLQQAGAIPLPDVSGRIDHLSVDLAGKRLFMAALGNNTVEVFDLSANKRLTTLRGFQEPQGLVYPPEFNRLYVANGGDGALTILDAKSFQVAAKVSFDDDADNVRYDLAQKQLYVGYGKGALGIFGVAAGKRIGDVKLDGHPESFQLEKSGPRIWVNVPSAGHVAVIDRRKRVVEARWPITQAAACYPMALDEVNRRLFLGCRKPAKILVLDTASGKVVAEFACVGDTDDLFYDARRKRLYVSGGEGSVSVFEQRDPDHYQPLAKVPGAPGARTSLYVPELDRLYLAVPKRPNQSSELRIYQAQ
ncbi:MAG: YncE family protein [Acidobacteria bacterium]|nr:YncE family protein [Acidobacteriota bacterium]